ncbi:MAG: hypothetical protein L0Y58_25690, partial [Verrucomicrobia subdivision 3 bacterium]|nr:hypothetical protein [Limisphaerales bacterium]
MPTKAKIKRSSPRAAKPVDGEVNVGELDGDGRVNSISPVQPQLLSRINEALVLRAIRQHGPS